MRNQWKVGGAAIALTIAAAGLAIACGGDPVGPQPTMYVAQMSGANEAPAVATGATGTATFTLTGRTLSYTVNVNGLSGNAAASHIHLGAAGTNGGIVYPFTAASLQTGQVASGTIDLDQPVSNGTSSISGDSLLTLLDRGMVYTNVHTPANPAGEIRGQITRSQTAAGGY
jgi:CHRD domain-containing protein